MHPDIIAHTPTTDAQIAGLSRYMLAENDPQAELALNERGLAEAERQYAQATSRADRLLAIDWMVHYAAKIIRYRREVTR